MGRVRWAGFLVAAGVAAVVVPGLAATCDPCPDCPAKPLNCTLEVHTVPPSAVHTGIAADGYRMAMAVVDHC